ncbi:MAG: hypothetical protein RJA70_180 [Pseudomonadota bacterium]|jgi:hypothetical protein
MNKTVASHGGTSTQLDKPRLLLIELNEFNDSLLRDAARDLRLSNIQKIFDLSHCKAKTDDPYESDLLEPWVQWVSIHTGTPSSVHQVKHLGDVPSLKFPQVWETLSRAGVTTGIWGVLNGSRGHETEHNEFFLPDPWTFSEAAHPQALEALLGLPRYAATNRLRMFGPELAWHVLKCFKVLLKHSLFEAFVRELPAVVKVGMKHRREFVGFCLFEYLSGLLFLEYWGRYRPQFGVVFLNGLAHLQHYYWHGVDYARNERLAYGLRLVDKFLGQVLETIGPETRLVVSSGLSQENTNDEPEWVSYRPRDHATFLRGVGVAFKSVEPLMSYDALIFFGSADDKLQALAKLRSAKVGNQSLFLVEEYPLEPLKLFYRFQFTQPVGAEAGCSLAGVDFEFGKFFSKIVTRTGRHVQASDIYANDANLPAHMLNHELCQYILGYFGVSAAGLE